MQHNIDATGKACPIPFMLAKKEIDNGTKEFSVLVDNTSAVENLKRLGSSQGCSVTVSSASAPYTVNFSLDGTAPAAESEEATHHIPKGDYLLKIDKDTMGIGEHELGRNLLRMFLYTVDQGDDIPETIVCLNSGVFMATRDEQSIATLRSLEAKGVQIIVCGTCLDYYRLMDTLQVGTIGNMYDIATAMVRATRIVTP